MSHWKWKLLDIAINGAALAVMYEVAGNWAFMLVLVSIWNFVDGLERAHWD